MKLNFTILLFICCFHSGYSQCGLVRGIKIEPSFYLSNFKNFINNGTAEPKEKLVYENRSYSPNYNYYFENNLTGKSVLHDSSGKKIAVVRGLVNGEHLIWLNDYVIADGWSAPDPEKTIIQLSTGETTSFKTKTWFMFVGQTNKKAWFVSHSDRTSIGDISIKHRHTIVSLGEEGLKLESENIPEGKSWPYLEYFYDFFHPLIYIRHQKTSDVSDDEPPLKTEIEMKNKKKWDNDSIDFFYAQEDSFCDEQNVWLKIHDNEIYKITHSSIEKVFDFKEANIEGWIREFRIEKNYLIFRSQNNGFIDGKNYITSVNGLKVNIPVYGYHTIGIVNLETKEVFYPQIIK